LVALYAQPEFSLSTIQPVFTTTTTPQNTTHNYHKSQQSRINRYLHTGRFGGEPIAKTFQLASCVWYVDVYSNGWGSGSGECQHASGCETPAIRDEKTYNLTHLGGDFGGLIRGNGLKRAYGWGMEERERARRVGRKRTTTTGEEPDKAVSGLVVGAVGQSGVIFHFRLMRSRGS